MPTLAGIITAIGMAVISIGYAAITLYFNKKARDE